MREIKFRAWDKAEEKMIPADSLAFEEYAPLVDLLSGDGIMQYTGLKDMSDIEIYEGDVVKRCYELGDAEYDSVSLGFVGYEVRESGYFIGIVTYRPSAGFILNKCRKYDDEDNLISKRSGVKIYSQYAEVIGNIYENPELLVGDQHGQTR